jgi:hypothetical protein
MYGKGCCNDSKFGEENVWVVMMMHQAVAMSRGLAVAPQKVELDLDRVTA